MWILEGEKLNFNFEEKPNTMKMEMKTQDRSVFLSKHTGSNPQLISAPVNSKPLSPLMPRTR